MRRIVECVPNISNGRDPGVYNTVADAVRHVEHASAGAVRLLGVDPGADTNRTVITFAGEPDAVLEAALALARKTFALIDMRLHHGAHPRQGALDVLPFVPVSGVSMEECVALARRAGEEIGKLGVPVWLYEHAASRPERRNLSDLRAGEYEALPEKLGTAEWVPDYGPNAWNADVARTGVCAVGARKFLIAYNINFNTRSVKLVSDIALSIREKGRIARTPEGRFMRDATGAPVYMPGMFSHLKALGWYLPEFQLVQLTMNLTDWEATPPHEVFDTVQELALERGLRVTGSELVGLIPLAAMRAAGKYFLAKQAGVGTGASEAELLRVAVQSMGLAELRPWDSHRQVVEFALEGRWDGPPCLSSAECHQQRPQQQPHADRQSRLSHLSLRSFADELASSSAAPGGGSAAALAGALAAALAAMMPNLTVGKKGYKGVAAEMNAIAEEAQQTKDALLAAIDDDTAAFNALLAAYKLPKATDAQRAVHEAAVAEATRGAIEVPLSVLERMPRVLELLAACAERGNQNALSDALTGAALALACATGAHANVLINLKGMPQDAWTADTRQRADDTFAKCKALVDSIGATVLPKLGPEKWA